MKRKAETSTDDLGRMCRGGGPASDWGGPEPAGRSGPEPEPSGPEPSSSAGRSGPEPEPGRPSDVSSCAAAPETELTTAPGVGEASPSGLAEESNTLVASAPPTLKEGHPVAVDHNGTQSEAAVVEKAQATNEAEAMRKSDAEKDGEAANKDGEAAKKDAEGTKAPFGVGFEGGASLGALDTSAVPFKSVFVGGGESSNGPSAGRHPESFPGEEEEQVEFSDFNTELLKCVKESDNGKWRYKSLGYGVFRILSSKEGGDVRMVFRSSGTWHVLLNSPSEFIRDWKALDKGRFKFIGLDLAKLDSENKLSVFVIKFMAKVPDNETFVKHLSSC